MRTQTRVIGIDPGYAIVGYGVLDYSQGRFGIVRYGAVTTPTGIPFARRLELIYDELAQILSEDKPHSMAIEKLFFTTNQKTAFDVAQARGVVQLCAVKQGIELAEYTPLEVKMAVAGYGKAEKLQVQQMTKTLLNLPAIPKPDDVADALAVAICHAHTAASSLNKQNLLRMMR